MAFIIQETGDVSTYFAAEYSPQVDSCFFQAMVTVAYTSLLLDELHCWALHFATGHIDPLCITGLWVEFHLVQCNHIPPCDTSPEFSY